MTRFSPWIKYLLTSVLVLVVVGGAFYLGYWQERETLAKPDLRQAVFLDNDQVYFGKLVDQKNGYLVLEDVYYLKSTSNLQVGRDELAKKISLVKLGDEIHGPEDGMFINRDHVLFYENMKESSKINTSIKKFVEEQESN